jgi:hypothetical protein
VHPASEPSKWLDVVDVSSRDTAPMLRMVRALDGGDGVALEIDGSPPRYLCWRGGVMQALSFDTTPAFRSSETSFLVERGLADPQGLTLRYRADRSHVLRAASGRLTLSPTPTDDAGRQEATFTLESRPVPPQHSSFIRSGETLRVGEYRRSPSGLYVGQMDASGRWTVYFLSKLAEIYVEEAGQGNATPPPGGTGAPDAGYTLRLNGYGSLQVSRSDGSSALSCEVNVRSGQEPRSHFAMVTDEAHLLVLQGTPDDPGEAVWSTRFGKINWVVSRKRVLLRTAQGRYVTALNGGSADPNFTGSMVRHDGTIGPGRYETFELQELWNGFYALRTSRRFYVAPVGSSQYVGAYLKDILDGSTWTFKRLSDGSVAFLTRLRGGGQINDPPTGTQGEYLIADASGQLLAQGFAPTDPDQVEANARFTLIEPELDLPLLSDQSFGIEAVHSGQRLSVDNASSNNDASIVQRPYTGGDEQRFRLTYLREGRFQLTGVHSGRSIDVWGGSTADGTRIIQWDSGNGANQQLQLRPEQDGTYSIIACHSGKCLEVEDSSQAPGARLLQRTYQGTPNQRFRIFQEAASAGRVLIADFASGRPPVHPAYLEGRAETSAFSGFCDPTDWCFAGDFAGRGYDQILLVNRGGSGAKLAVIDFMVPHPPACVRYTESWGQNATLSGWLDDNDTMLVGDFTKSGRKQLMKINRSGGGGFMAIVELEAMGFVQRYSESWGSSTTLGGWVDANDINLVGDFRGRGCDQILCVNRSGSGGRVLINGYEGGISSVHYREEWSQSNWLSGWLDDTDLHFAGDFLGLGRAQWLMIDRGGGRLRIVDMSAAAPQVLLETSTGSILGGWLDVGSDIQLTGAFTGSGRAQLLCINRANSRDGKLMILEFGAPGTAPVTRFWESWGQRSPIDDFLIPARDSRLVGRFTDMRRSQLLCLSRGEPALSGLAPGRQPGPLLPVGGQCAHLHERVFVIRNKASQMIMQITGAVRTDGGPLTQGGNAGQLHQSFRLRHVPERDRFMLIAEHSQKPLGVTGGSTSELAPLVQSPLLGPAATTGPTPSESQLFAIWRIDDGSYLFQVQQSGRFLCIQNGTTEWGSPVVQASPAEQPQAFFRWELVETVQPVEAAPVLPATSGNRWLRLGESAGFVALAWHLGNLYGIANNRLWLRNNLSENSGSAWQDVGEAYYVTAMASHQGSLYVVSNNRLWKRGAIGPGTGNDWTEVGEAYHVTAMASHQGSLYVLSNGHLWKRGAIGPGTGNAWTESGDTAGATGLASIQGALYTGGENRLRKRGAIGPGTGNVWTDAGGAEQALTLASSDQTLFMIAGGALYALAKPAVRPLRPRGWTPLGGGPTHPPSISSSALGRLEVCARGSDGAVWVRSFDGQWSDWRSLGGQSPGEVKLLALAPGQTEAFVRGMENQVFSRTSDSSWQAGWATRGGNISTGISAFSPRAGRKDVFVRNADGSAGFLYYEQAWTWVSLGGGSMPGPHDAVCDGGRYTVFMRGLDNALWTIESQSPGGPFGPWTSLGGQHAGSPSAVCSAPGSTDVFLRGSDGALWVRSRRGGVWSAWQSLGGALTSDPIAISALPGRVDVFARGTDAAVWRRSFNGSAWADWQRLGGQITGRPSVASSEPGVIDIAVLATDQSIKLFTLDL